MGPQLNFIRDDPVKRQGRELSFYFLRQEIDACFIPSWEIQAAQVPIIPRIAAMSSRSTRRSPRSSHIKPELRRVKIEGLGTLRVGRKVLQFTDDTRKWNPNSLRFLIGFMMNLRFNGERLAADEYFSRVPSAYRHEKDELGNKTLNNKSIGDILNDNTHIYYWQIECFARLFDMPAGAMLLLSRVLSHVRDGKRHKAASDIDGIVKMAPILKRILETGELSETDINDLSLCFIGNTDQAEIPNLLSVPPSKDS